MKAETISVAFHSTFSNSGRYNVRFEHNRLPLRRQHQTLAIQSASSRRLLFPDLRDAPLERIIDNGDVSISPFNKLISNNAEQLRAVRSIVHMNAGKAPFIVFGP